MERLGACSTPSTTIEEFLRKSLLSIRFPIYLNVILSNALAVPKDLLLIVSRRSGRGRYYTLAHGLWAMGHREET